MCIICTGEYNEFFTYLYCNNTKITSIPSTLTNLQELFCDNTLITSIPSILVNLQVLYCYNTLITSIPNNVELYTNNKWINHPFTDNYDKDISKLITSQRHIRKWLIRKRLSKNCILKKHLYRDLLLYLLH